ncbi:hypothetical protein ACNOYE_13380 [Nannocystaceae bacterium ST9]
MASPVHYKKKRFNFVAIALVLILAAGVYAAYLFLPLKLRESEVLRVLDEISSDFTGKAPRMLAEPDEVKKLHRKMKSDLQTVGVTDPNAEYWIEIDDDNQVRFGVLYSDYVELPFREPLERVHELEMICSRLGVGTGWTCETRDLQEERPDQLVETP